MGPQSTSAIVILLLSDGNIKVIDFVNDANTTEIETIHDKVRVMKVCPNGRYIATGGDKGDICLWSLRRA